VRDGMPPSPAGGAAPRREDPEALLLLPLCLLLSLLASFVFVDEGVGVPPNNEEPLRGAPPNREDPDTLLLLLLLLLLPDEPSPSARTHTRGYPEYVL